MNKQKAKLAKRLLTIGLFVMIAVAIACFALAMYFFDNPRIAPHSLYNAGVDVLGTLICAVLFFGCMSQLENATFHFVSLVLVFQRAAAVPHRLPDPERPDRADGSGADLFLLPLCVPDHGL